MTQMLKELLGAFGLMRRPEPAISPRERVNEVRVHCADCDRRTLMTIRGACHVCGGTSVFNSAKLALEGE